MKLVIAEKPSVAGSISKVIGAYERHNGYYEGSGYLVSWCIGHLLSPAEPHCYQESYGKWRKEDLPIIPETFKWELSEAKKDQYMILKKLLERDDVDQLICATDAGREGELIFRLVYQESGCNKPFLRLWISSMEDQAIKEGFDNLKPSQNYDALYATAMCRCKADWLVGINATRLFTTMYHSRLTVGRVQTPTLAMIAERQKEIEDFRKEKYFTVNLEWNNLTAVTEKISDQKEAREIAGRCNGKDAVVASVKTVQKTESAPHLYDLTTLQREANRIFSFTAQKTLNAAQRLYEKKLITYPRTDSRYLTDDMEDTAIKLVDIAAGMLKTKRPESVMISPLINNAKVTDHHAILPTAEAGTADLSALSNEELSVLKLICAQLLCAVGNRYEYQETEAKIMCEGVGFTAKGKLILDEGWKKTEELCKASLSSVRNNQKKEAVLPDLMEGQILSSVDTTLSEHYTQPPKPYTEDTLLSRMETAGNQDFDEDTEKKGLGTPATRASIIEKLVSSGYVSRKGKQLIPTEAGKNLIEVVPEIIKSPKLTAEWENTLLQIERGNQDPEEFMQKITDMVRSLIAQYETSETGTAAIFQASCIGRCPRCGSPVIETAKGFTCSDHACRFILWKENRYLKRMRVNMTKDLAEKLLKDGRVHMKKLYSEKKKKYFEADLVLNVAGETVSFELDFSNDQKKGV